MPPSNEPIKEKVFRLHATEPALLYPAEAYDFVQKGLAYTVQQIHGRPSDSDDAKMNRHVSGDQLCLGLRDYAVSQWGLMAGTVMRRWELRSTLDFGRIVFHLIEMGQMQKTDRDCLDDFRNVYDFRSGFEAGYRIPVEAVQ